MVTEMFTIQRILWAFMTNFLIGYVAYYLYTRDKKKSLISGITSILVDVDHAIYMISSGILLDYSITYFHTPYRFLHLPFLIIAPFLFLRKETRPVGVGIIAHVITDLVLDPWCQKLIGIPIG